MKKGFMLTAIAILLFVLLLDMAFQYADSSSIYSKMVSDIIVSDKVDYTFDDVTQDVTNITGLSISQSGIDLVIADSFPASNITGMLDRYETFVRSYYLTPELQATFLDSNNNPISLKNIASEIDVWPSNMSYKYSSFNKTDLSIQIPYGQLGGVTFIWYNFTVTSGNFSQDVSSISWSTPPTACTQGAAGCVSFYLQVNDSSQKQYSTDLPNYHTFSITQPAGHLNLTFANQSCWFDVWVGNYSGTQYLLNMTVHNCTIQSQIGFSFNSSALWLAYPAQLRVRDANYNTSKQDAVNVIVTTTLR